MEKLSTLLWREREVLDDLRYHLEVEQLLLAANRTGWLSRVTAEVEDDLVQVQRVEVARAISADEVAGGLGLPSAPTLDELVVAAPDPWSTILAEHRDALVLLMREVAALAETNAELIGAGARAVRESLLGLDERAAGYTADGAVASSAPAARRVDQVL